MIFAQCGMPCQVTYQRRDIVHTIHTPGGGFLSTDYRLRRGLTYTKGRSKGAKLSSIYCTGRSSPILLGALPLQFGSSFLKYNFNVDSLPAVTQQGTARIAYAYAVETARERMASNSERRTPVAYRIAPQWRRHLALATPFKDI